MLSFNEVYLPVMLIVDLNLARVIQHSPSPWSSHLLLFGHACVLSKNLDFREGSPRTDNFHHH